MLCLHYIVKQTSAPSAQCVAHLRLPQLADYKFVLVTVERKSNLFFHIQRAWLGAHMRLALTAAGVPGGCRAAGGVWAWMRAQPLSAACEVQVQMAAAAPADLF